MNPTKSSADAGQSSETREAAQVVIEDKVRLNGRVYALADIQLISIYHTSDLSKVGWAIATGVGTVFICVVVQLLLGKVVPLLLTMAGTVLLVSCLWAGIAWMTQHRVLGVFVRMRWGSRLAKAFPEDRRGAEAYANLLVDRITTNEHTQPRSVDDTTYHSGEVLLAGNSVYLHGHELSSGRLLYDLRGVYDARVTSYRPRGAYIALGIAIATILGIVVLGTALAFISSIVERSVGNFVFALEFAVFMFGSLAVAYIFIYQLETLPPVWTVQLVKSDRMDCVYKTEDPKQAAQVFNQVKEYLSGANAA